MYGRTGDDGAFNADRTAVLDKLQKDVHIVEELRDDEVRARIDLFLVVCI